MKTLKIFSILTFISFLFASNYFKGEGPKPKKIYKDTIYRWKTKPTKPNNPAHPAHPAQPAKVEVAEENRSIRITSPVTHIRVRKSMHKLYAYFADTFKVFRISLGASPVGHKVRQGDNRTPEGTYKISFKNPNSRGYKSLKISYPNDNDRANASKLGVSPGGDICIHGLWWPTQDPKNHWKDNWTQGCMAINNAEIDELYAHTEVDTEVTILP